MLSRLPTSILASAAALAPLKKRMPRSDFEVLIRDMRRMERFPTIARGLEALKMRTMLEWWSRRESVIHTKSPFTDLMQRPYFFFPGIRATPFYDPATFAWVSRLEAAAPVILQEFQAVLATGFRPNKYFEDPGIWLLDGGFVGDDGPPLWNQLHLWSDGKRASGASLCPRTTEVIEGIPRFRGLGLACISALNPGAWIAPHYGPINGILRVHLGLSVPDGCILRVGREKRSWQDGKVLIFDDSFEHEVRHDGNRTRFVLLFDIWHPDWTDEEVRTLEEMLGQLSYRTQLDDDKADMLKGRRWWI